MQTSEHRSARKNPGRIREALIFAEVGILWLLLIAVTLFSREDRWDCEYR